MTILVDPSPAPPEPGGPHEPADGSDFGDGGRGGGGPGGGSSGGSGGPGDNRGGGGLPPSPFTPPQADPLARRWAKLAAFMGIFVAAGLAAISGLSIDAGKSGVVLPLALGTGVVLGLLALTRFQAYVMIMLFLRASIDLAKLSGKAAGNTSTNGAGKALDPSSLLAVLFIVAAALWLMAQYRRTASLPGSPVRRALLFFFACGIASILASENPGPSGLEALRIMAVVMMFVVLEQLMRDSARCRQILKAALCSAVIPLGVVAIGFASGHPRSEQKGAFTRIIGTFNQSNEFGIFLALMIVMGAALYPHISKRSRRYLAFLMIGEGVCLLLTYTRSALVGAVIGLVVVGAIQSKRILGALAIVAIVSLGVLPSVAGRFSDLGATSSTTTIVNGHSQQETNSLTWRFGYWTQVLPLANRSPVIGIGLNQTQYNTDKAKQPHNDFVRAYVETGFVGLLAYISLHVALLGLGRRAKRLTTPGTFDRGIAAGFLGCAAAFLAISVVANVISGVVNLWYFFAFAAAASAAVWRSKHHPDEEPAVLPGRDDERVLVASPVRSDSGGATATVEPPRDGYPAPPPDLPPPI